MKYLVVPDMDTHKTGRNTLKREMHDHALLQVRAGEAYIPVVSSFAGNMATALGLGQSEALALTLAAEEVFSLLCRVVSPEAGWIEVSCSGGGYYVRTDFVFPAADLDMRAFNIAATVSLSDDSEMEQMGLLLASRSVDRFRVDREEGQKLRLTLIKEKVYPLLRAEGVAPPVELLESFTVRPPDSGELKLFAELVHTRYRDGIVPDVFNYPGKLLDMVGGGEYQAVVAAGPSGAMGGGTFWHWTGARAVEWFGPYLFSRDPDGRISSALLESCIGAIARSPAVVLINRFPTPEFPRQDFEYLGSLAHHAKDGTTSMRDAWARLMREDLGSVAWAHPRLHDFLRGEYDRLVLPREIVIVTEQGERRSRHSVLLSTFDRLQGNVMLQPVWSGDDFQANLIQHMELFRREGILDVFFAIDLGQSWEAEFAPGLVQNGFKPRMILPCAGRAGDLVVFQFEGAF
jgi:hypothetical protein